MSEKNTLDRRSFIKIGLAGLATATVGATLTRTQVEADSEAGQEPQGSPHRWAMVMDLSKCNGCGQCVMSCRAHNDVPPSMAWTELQETREGGPGNYLPVPCMHCAEAPCVDVCPVKASYYREDGIVMMDYDRCIGCRYCEIACPYGARSFNWETFTGENPAVPAWGQPDVPRRPRGVVEKCSFCFNRIDRGLAAGLTPGVDPMATPACVVTCPQKARIFGDLNDPESNVSKLLAENPHFRLREELGTEPRVYYLPADEMEVAS